MKSQLLVHSAAGIALLLTLTACAGAPEDAASQTQDTESAISESTQTEPETEPEEAEEDAAEPGTGTLVLEFGGKSYEMEGTCRYNPDFDPENFGQAETFWSVVSADKDVYPQLSIIAGGDLAGEDYVEVAFIYPTEEDMNGTRSDSVYTPGDPDTITGTAVSFWDDTQQAPFTITCPD